MTDSAVSSSVLDLSMNRCRLGKRAREALQKVKLPMSSVITAGKISNMCQADLLLKPTHWILLQQVVMASSSAGVALAGRRLATTRRVGTAC